MRKRRFVLTLFALILYSTLFAAEATLEIVSGSNRQVFKISELLARKDVENLQVPDSDYGSKFSHFKAVKIENLFQGVAVPEDAFLQFQCTDGFSAFLEKKSLFTSDPKASRAYLAIEDPKHPWPHLDGKKVSAGPFYLVWINPGASGIGREEWPFQIARFNVVGDLKSVFPKMYPNEKSGEKVHSGFAVFKKNCLPCHKINGAGAAIVAPDLNIPMNPTEYFTSGALKKLIRDPASVRTWPNQKMPAFTPEVLSDSELENLISYLGHMARK